jgi:hypothetical protein
VRYDGTFTTLGRHCEALGDMLIVQDLNGARMEL